MNWFAENVFLTFLFILILLVVILAIYFKLYVRIIYEGTTYKHFRKGLLLRESNKGGTVFLLPFFDKLEIVNPAEPTSHSFDDNEFE
ncbi:MAG: hypothetical protein RTV31_14905 [Candidatus Thorarchaeota archaeon]